MPENYKTLNRNLYVPALFLGAFLLLSVQPLFSKMLLAGYAFHKERYNRPKPHTSEQAKRP